MSGSSGAPGKRAVAGRLAVLWALAAAIGCGPAPAPAAPAVLAQAPSAGAPGAAAPQSAPVAADVSPALGALIDGARQEGALDLVWSANQFGGTAGAQQLQDLLNRRYGLNLAVSYTSGPAGPTTGTRVVQEVAAGQRSHTDIHLLVDASIMSAFQPADWRQYEPELPADDIYYGGRAVGLITQLPGITYNRELVPPDRVPRSLQDLLDPW